jgi:RNA polymerase sigma factor (sigma-70 family)
VRERHDLETRFAAERDRLRALAYRMLGSLDDADDAVQQTWLRVDRTDLSDVDNLPGWLTTVISRVCLDMLRARGRRGERPLTTVADAHVRATSGTAERDAVDPVEEAVMAESVSRALLVVLERLSPAQRVAFVLHDLFAVPFEVVADVIGRSTVATKKLASRARHRVHGAPPSDPAARSADRAVVAAFLAASRDGDFETLLALLAPDVVRRADRVAATPPAAAVVRGARAVAEETRVFAERARRAEVALVDGAPAIVIAPGGRLFGVIMVTVDAGRITEVEVVADPSRLAELSVTVDAEADLRGVPSS